MRLPVALRFSRRTVAVKKGLALTLLREQQFWTAFQGPAPRPEGRGPREVQRSIEVFLDTRGS
jgi:hypothetical protein